MRLRLLPFGFILSVLVALCAGLPTRTFAQAGTSGLTGTVTDSSGTAHGSRAHRGPRSGHGILARDGYEQHRPRVVVAGRDVPRSLTPTEKYDFGPRIGAAYRINDATVVRSGYGLFFDTAPISYYQDAVENLPWIREDQQSLSAFQFGQPPSEAFIGYLLDDPPIGSFTPGPNTFQVGFKNSFVHHWNWSVQRQIGSSMVAEVAYAGHWAERLNRRENLNTAEPRSPNAQIPTTVHPQFRRALPFAVFEDQLIVRQLVRNDEHGGILLQRLDRPPREAVLQRDHVHQLVHVRQNAERCSAVQRRQQRHRQPHPGHLQ